MLAKQAGEDGDDEDWEEDDAEETALEGYTTTVDDEDNFVDEYQIFKAILQSKMSRSVVRPSRDLSMSNVLLTQAYFAAAQIFRAVTQHGTRH